MADLRGLLSRYPHAGTLEAICLRPARGALVRSVAQAQVLEGRGLVGDRTGDAPPHPGKRHVTLIQAEHIPLIGAWTRHPSLDAAVLRRNLVVRGINLLAARSPLGDLPVRVMIGPHAVLEISGPCDPCSKMETALGTGAYNAMRGHGGVTARVLAGGAIAVGDAVRVQVVTTADVEARNGASEVPLSRF